MCGFVGYFNCGNEQLLKHATEVIAHRGPDNQTIYWDSNNCVGLGHRRLSIIDLSEGANQPFWDETNDWGIIFNGEIFNFKEIKQELYSKGVSFTTQGDTEIILKGFIHFGKDILKKMNGMFSFVIYNKKENTVFAARDHVGIKPFYYYHKNNSLIIASEVKSILATVNDIEPDYEALATPLYFQTAPNTGFKNIFKLKPGHFLEFKNGTLEIQEYWNIKADRINSKSFEEKKEELTNLLEDSVKMQMLADVPIGVLLSGGLDSSLIAALMRCQYQGEINSFTIKINKEDLQKQGIVDDSSYAKQVADLLNFKHHEIQIEPKMIDLLPKMVYHLEEIIVDPAAINTYLISKSAKEMGIHVLLSGIGADEIFAGYRIHSALNQMHKKNSLINNFIGRGIGAGINSINEGSVLTSSKYVRWLKKIGFMASLEESKRHVYAKDSAIIPEVYEKLFKLKYNVNELNHISRERELYNKFETNYLNKVCLSDASIFLPDHNLAYMDKSMMAASIEGRPPLIDYRIVEFAFGLNEKDKINNGVQKYILKEVARNFLPSNIIDRQKAPFAAPLRSWIKNDLKEMVFDLLTPENIQKRGLFNDIFVSKVLKEHYAGKTDHSQLIFRFLITEIWFSTFFDKK